MHGRSGDYNPTSRFLAHQVERDPELAPEESRATRFWRDDSRTIISRNSSPDIPFDASLNVYRGCEHGCAYCYARPTHEYLGLSAGLDFETQIFIKHEAPALLRGELMKRSWKPQVIAMSGVTDPYQPIERKLALTRACLQVLAEFANPVQIVTKNALVLRDQDILEGMARLNLVHVQISLCSLDAELARKMEPRACSPERKLSAVRALAAAGIPVKVMMAPIIPGLNDHEIPALAQAASQAGARAASCLPLRLPGAVLPVFESWLRDNFPGRFEKVFNKVRSLRGGQTNDSRFHHRFRGQGEQADLIDHLYRVALKKTGLAENLGALATEHFRRPESDAPRRRRVKGAGEQLELF